jgi:hypothetical protein
MDDGMRECCNDSLLRDAATTLNTPSDPINFTRHWAASTSVNLPVRINRSVTSPSARLSTSPIRQASFRAMWPSAGFPTLRRFPLIALAPALLLAGCCQSTLPPLTPADMAQSLPRDKKTLDNIASHNAGLQKEFLTLKSSGGWQKRGYFSAEERDRIELRYFRLHTVHHQLGVIVDRNEGSCSSLW